VNFVEIFYHITRQKTWKRPRSGIIRSHDSRVHSTKVCNVDKLIFWVRYKNNCEKQQLSTLRLSDRPHGTTRFPLGGFSWNFIFGTFM